MFTKFNTDYIICKLMHFQTKYVLLLFLFFAESFYISANNLVTLTCPVDITIEIDPCADEAFLNYESLIWSNTETLADTTFSPPAGTPFLTGTTTVSLATLDTNGNLETCFFIVTVENPNSNSTVICNANVQVSLGFDCIIEFIPDMGLEGSGYCFGDLELEINNSFGNPIPNSPFLGIDDLGITYT